MTDLTEARQRRSDETAAAFAAIGEASPADRRRIENKVVVAHIALAESIARRYRRGDDDDSDLRQVALLGLVKAARRYDPERGTPFVPYAVPTIDGELKRHIRDHGWLVRPGRQMQELCTAVTRTRPRLAQALGREASEAELAAELGVTAREIHAALACLDAQSPVPVAANPDRDDDGPSVIPPVVDGGFERAEQRAMLAEALNGLDEREALIVQRRFAEEKTQAEIGTELGVSQMQVSRLLARTLERLRTQLEPTFPQGLRDAA
ncbi:MAG: sigma-70 family RNA polymerase sigma factor [Microbacteriaceae bacterium]|nr:sigma-70 family RNA polymerase sigma factor [Microbacteriaceae bacterium]MCL2794668.1 sigma-70 family RNA polymerase sigma factor [Microbacteriaceae bacterium]